MTPEQIAIVQSTWAKVAPNADAVAGMFYQRLFETAPEVTHLFKSNMTEQGRKLTQMISVAVNGLNNLEAIVPAVQAMGVRHVDYGVKETDYDSVGTALLWTLGEGLGDEFTEEAREAWSLTYSTLATVMIDAADRVVS